MMCLVTTVRLVFWGNCRLFSVSSVLKWGSGVECCQCWTCFLWQVCGEVRLVTREGGRGGSDQPFNAHSHTLQHTSTFQRTVEHTNCTSDCTNAYFTHFRGDIWMECLPGQLRGEGSTWELLRDASSSWNSLEMSKAFKLRNKTISDGSITVDFSIIKVLLLIDHRIPKDHRIAGDHQIPGDHRIAGIIE